MKNLDSIILEIKQQIRTRIINCPCRYRGTTKQVVELKSFSQELRFLEKFDLAEVPVSGPIIVNVSYNVLALVDINGNLKSQAYLDGNFGPLTLSFSSSEYHLDTSKATISGLTTD